MTTAMTREEARAYLSELVASRKNITEPQKARWEGFEAFATSTGLMRAFTSQISAIGSDVECGNTINGATVSLIEGVQGAMAVPAGREAQITVRQDRGVQVAPAAPAVDRSKETTKEAQRFMIIGASFDLGKTRDPQDGKDGLDGVDGHKGSKTICGVTAILKQFEKHKTVSPDEIKAARADVRSGNPHLSETTTKLITDNFGKLPDQAQLDARRECNTGNCEVTRAPARAKVAHHGGGRRRNCNGYIQRSNEGAQISGVGQVIGGPGIFFPPAAAVGMVVSGIGTITTAGANADAAAAGCPNVPYATAGSFVGFGFNVGGRGGRSHGGRPSHPGRPPQPPRDGRPGPGPSPCGGGPCGGGGLYNFGN